MTKEEKVIVQLESLTEHCKSMVDKGDPEDIWSKDIAALNYAMNLIKKESTAPQQVDPRENI